MRGRTWMSLVVAAVVLGAGGCVSGNHPAADGTGRAAPRAGVSSQAIREETTAAFAVPAASNPTSAPANLGAAVRDVADAPDIDAAVDAYTRGMQIDANSVALHKAYVQRVVELEVPQLAAS